MIRLSRTFAVVAGMSFAAICFAQDRTVASAFPVQLKVVTGVPFSARVTTESTQVLADGNRIVHESTAFIARDSDGRTQRRQSLTGAAVAAGSGAEASVVFIQDPVEGFSYVIEPQSRSVRRTSLSRAASGESGAETRSSDSTVDRLQSGDGAGVKSEPLGTQIIEGLVAQGTRLSRLLPADLAGNERPLEVVSETWYSTEIQTVVISKKTDPRLGETIYRITDLQLWEPQPSLFQIPDGYTMREEAETAGRNIEKSIKRQ